MVVPKTCDKGHVKKRFYRCTKGGGGGGQETSLQWTRTDPDHRVRTLES